MLTQTFFYDFIGDNLDNKNIFNNNYNYFNNIYCKCETKVL